MSLEEGFNRRKTYLDFLRVIAIFFVIFNHTGTSGFMLFTTTGNALLQYLYLFISIACKVAVPLFFMISGALLLGKNESIKDIYKNRILKYAIVLFVFSVVYYFYIGLTTGGGLI